MTTHHPQANTALWDQLRAASADTAIHMLALARDQGHHVDDRPGPVIAAIACRFATAPGPWRTCHTCRPRHSRASGSPAAPRCAMCGPCAVAATLAMRGTAEDNTCDGCRCYSHTLLASAVVVGCVSVSFGICSRCAAQENRIRLNQTQGRKP